MSESSDSKKTDWWFGLGGSIVMGIAVGFASSDAVTVLQLSKYMVGAGVVFAFLYMWATNE